MAKIEKYEDLRCWQESRRLVNDIYKLLNQQFLRKEFALSDQLKRAAISVMTNIAEGFNRFHKRDFIRFLDYAQSSAQEVKSLLYIISDIQKKEHEVNISEIQKRCDYCQALILALLKHVKNSIREPSGKTKESHVHYLAEEFINI